MLGSFMADFSMMEEPTLSLVHRAFPPRLQQSEGVSRFKVEVLLASKGFRFEGILQ